MNYITEIGDLTLYVKNLVDKHKTDFFNEAFFEFLNEDEKIEEYEEILEKHEFNYINGKRDGQIGYGSHELNKEIGNWIAEKTQDFLKPKKGTTPEYEKEMISKTQITTTFSAFANGIAQNYQGLEPTFFKYKEIRPLLERKFFAEAMRPEIKFGDEEKHYSIEKPRQTFNEDAINNLKENHLRSYELKNIKGEPREYFNYTNHKNKDILYAKQDLETRICNN